MTTVRHSLASRPVKRSPSQPAVDGWETPGEIIGRLALEVERREEAAHPEGRAALSPRLFMSLLIGLGCGFQASGYLVWAEGAKTPEGGWVAIAVTVAVSLLMLRWTR